MEIVFSCLQQYGLKIKPQKCSFFRKQVRYPGHLVVAGQGVKPNPEKVSAVQDWPEPTTVTELRSFLGFTSYFRKFIKNYSSIAVPLLVYLRGVNSKQKSSSGAKKVEFDEEARGHSKP